MTNPPDPTDTLRQALALHQRGRLAEAEILYRTALGQMPGNFDALHLLGVIALQRKDFAAAVSLIGQALTIASGHAPAHSNIGTALLELGRPGEALASFDRALALDPGYAEALNNRGIALRNLGRHGEALASYDCALALRPDYIDALNNRGNALRALGRPEEALASYDRALAFRPGDADMLNRRGNLLLALARPGEALASYDRALAIRPDSAEIWNNRGIAASGLDRPDEALASYERALALRPDYVEALIHRGAALRDLKRPAEALASVDRALALRPDDADALAHRAAALRDLGRAEAALDSFDRALALEPDHAGALLLRGEALRDLKRHEAAASDFERLLSIAPNAKYLRGEALHSRSHCCDWRDWHRRVEGITDEIRAGKCAATPFTFLAMSDSAEDQLKCARIFSKDKYAPSAQPVWNGERYDHERIRVAYLSADFHDHATAYLMAELFERHDQSRFETTALSFGPRRTSDLRPRLESAFTRFVDVRDRQDRDIALLLRQLEIDIAVDLKGFTAGSRPRILAFRPAPVQVNFLGFPGTMGADHIDYIIADRFVIPVDQRAFYSEQVVYLPDSYQPNDAQRRIGEDAPTRAAAGLPEAGFVFCSFNNNYKIAPPVFDVWMRLLHQVEGSVLWLLSDSPAAMRHLRRGAEERGVAPERLVFAPRLKMEQHLARHRLADLMLDTLPYNAHTTASDALWAGLPLITCPGASFAGRVAGSLLQAAGLPELIAPSLEDYEALALALARDPARLAALKAKLARQRPSCALFDTDRFRRHIEHAYETMWARQQQGEPPAGFAVAPLPTISPSNVGSPEA